MPKRSFFEILHKDNSCVIANKAPGLTVIPGRDPKNTFCLKEALEKHLGEPLFLVHRIDKDTSGIVLFATSLEYQRYFSTLFEKSEIDKRYQAFTDGVPGFLEWKKIEEPILIKGNQHKVQIHKSGKSSITLAKELENYKANSLLEIKLLTGRTHQIRVHLAHIGHPLMIDPLYGKRSELMLSEILRRRYKSKKGESERAFIDRQTLHASSIAFLHPITNETLKVDAPFPKDLRALQNQLRKNK